LKTQNTEKEQLETEKKEKDAVNAKLRSREKELNKDLLAKQKQDAKLKSGIVAAIRRAQLEEAKKQESLAKNDAAKGTSNANATTTTTKAVSNKSMSIFDANAEEKLASDNFEKNKRKLPWPVESGNVTMEFGKHKVLEGSPVEYDNQSLTIETKEGASVKAVFDGEVTSIMYIGDVTAVVLRHGKYFTSYSGLGSVSVTKGQSVKVGQTLGRMAEKKDGLGELEFTIMTDKLVNLNPRLWLR